MDGRRHRVQLILFLAALLLPCALLVALALGIARQDRELRGKHQLDEQKRIAAQAQKALAASLDSIRAAETRTELEPGEGYRFPETVFVAWEEDGRLALPWEPDHARPGRRNRELFSQPEFAAAVESCVAARSASAGLAALNECYKRAAAAARQPAQAAYARWLWAVALASAGRAAQAEALYRALLEAGPELTDEEGIPLRLQAAQALSESGSARGIAASLESALALRPWSAPTTAYLIKDVAGRLTRSSLEAERAAAAALLRKAEERMRLLQQADSLQGDFPRIAALLGSRPAGAWAAYGGELWLVGAAGADRGNAILALRASDVFRRLAMPGATRFAGADEGEGEPLGERFPGLKLVLDPSALAASGGAADSQRKLLYVALALVVIATLFGVYLLWRDMQREMRLVELRAQFVSSVSHELKTPLTAIRMFAETLQLGRCKEPAEQNEYLGTIVNECERLTRLVDGVLLFSKMEQGKRVFRFRPVNAADAVLAALRAIEYPLAQGGFRLKTDVDEGLPRVHADRDALEQAVLNLLSNAMKYSGESREIELSLYGENGETVIRVADRGVGIAADEQSRIFESFYRSPSHENQTIPGAGLGLALVAQIVKAHRGRVVLESEPGKGSVFYLRLPADAGGAATQEERK
jgi:two-component system, OmpR family, phosphate regulon sensor histidine kinase PhoR